MSKLFKIISKEKKILLLILGVGLILSLTPIKPAQAADIWSSIFDAVKDIPNFIVGGGTWILGWGFLLPMFMILIVGCFISAALFYISLFLLKWVASGYLITLPFTHGGIVDKGWQATQSLANLGFVLVLVFIALSTILRLENYSLKKLLPKLILVIILINFSAVICGMVVDIANAVTRSFLNFDPFTAFSSMFNPFQQDMENIKIIMGGKPLEGLFLELKSIATFSSIVERAMKYIVATFFGIFASFIFGLYFLLFLLRYIALWILVILAPIAWFCWILPDSKSIYQAWEKYFVQWAFIGAIGGFFLKLGAIAMTSLSGGTGMITTPNIGNNQWMIDLLGFFFASLNSIILGIAVLIFLIVGFIISIKFSGGGTEQVLNWGKKGLDSAGGWAASKGKSWAIDKVANSERIQSIANRMATAKTPGAGATSGFASSKLGRALSGAANPLYAGVRATGKAAGPGLTDAQKMNIEKAEKEVEKSSTNSIISKFRNATDGPSRVGYINSLIKNNNLDEAIRNGLNPDEIAKTMTEASKYNAHKDIVNAMPYLDKPRLDGLVGPGLKYRNFIEAYQGEITSKIKPNKASNISESVYERTATGTHARSGTKLFNNPELLEAIVKSWDERHYSKLYETHGPKAIEAVEDRIKQVAADAGMTPDAWLTINNPKLNSYRKTSAGKRFFTLP